MARRLDWTKATVRDRVRVQNVVDHVLAADARETLESRKRGKLRTNVVRVLRESGEPIHLKEIQRALRQAGKPASARQVTSILSELEECGVVQRVGDEVYKII